MPENFKTREDDKRSIVDPEKLRRIEYFFEHGRTDIAWVKKMKLTNKEKAAILRDPRFLDIFDAKMLDYFIGFEKIDRGILDLTRLIIQRLGLTKGASPAVQVKATRIVIDGGKKERAIEAQAD